MFGRVATGVAVVSIVAWAFWQVGTLRHIEARAAAERSVPASVGEAIRERLAAEQEGPCLVASSDAYPQVAFAAGCRGRQLGSIGGGATPRSPDVADEAIVLVTRSPITPEQMEDPRLRSLGEPAPGWFVYRAGQVPT